MKVFCLTVRISLHILPICLLRDLQINTACFTEIKTREDFLRIQKIKVIFCSALASLRTSWRIPNNRHEMKRWGKWVFKCQVKFRRSTAFTCSCVQSRLVHFPWRFNAEVACMRLQSSHVTMDPRYFIPKLVENYTWVKFAHIRPAWVENLDLGEDIFLRKL